MNDVAEIHLDLSYGIAGAWSLISATEPLFRPSP
jgi:hypothetical protein